MKLIPYLNFDGDCEAAFKFYEQVLGGKLSDMMTYGNSPMAGDTPPEWHSKVMHTSLIVGDQEIMGSDCLPDYFEEPKGTSILLHVEDSEKAEKVFKDLSENGTIKMDIQETFWAKRFGTLVDQFGIPWMINCDKAS
ncbi:MAG: VOC family protein [Leptolyngbyaceae cyanobacterium SM1_1_3]|nr:VOC family protein [Leptolyngbyaceae cyanobacterium SM1_1_3]NJN02711.1 VOC family protein [Leptolyngbyaceae cyanobacterium RM1_1_2]NJO11626.1 VOC family protein [Leptolyngbyaceae cyanobacterium SL_1_1]